jgi:nucleotide-binding universal stress UspA family protein
MDARTLANAHAALVRQGREAFERFMTARDVAPVCRHLVNGPPAREIPAVARRTGAELVVMGAVSRSGLRRVFIGSTAERVLDALPCDVLVIRPRGTRTQVAPREQGMRVVRAPATPLVA